MEGTIERAGRGWTTSGWGLTALSILGGAAGSVTSWMLPNQPPAVPALDWRTIAPAVVAGVALAAILALRRGWTMKEMAWREVQDSLAHRHERLGRSTRSIGTLSVSAADVLWFIYDNFPSGIEQYRLGRELNMMAYGSGEIEKDNAWAMAENSIYFGDELVREDLAERDTSAENCADWNLCINTNGKELCRWSRRGVLPPTQSASRTSRPPTGTAQ